MGEFSRLIHCNGLSAVNLISACFSFVRVSHSAIRLCLWLAYNAAARRVLFLTVAASKIRALVV